MQRNRELDRAEAGREVTAACRDGIDQILTQLMADLAQRLDR